MSRDYTVVYALVHPRQPNQTRVDYAPSEVCYHHVARVSASHARDAIDCCREDTIPGFSFRTIAVFEGNLISSDIGKDVVVHDFRTETTS